jgi:hypothetical protein
MKRHRPGRALRRRYGKRKGHALPLIPIALAKLGALEKAERALMPLGKLAASGWGYVTGRKAKKKRRSR